MKIFLFQKISTINGEFKISEKMGTNKQDVEEFGLNVLAEYEPNLKTWNLKEAIKFLNNLLWMDCNNSTSFRFDEFEL